MVTLTTIWLFYSLACTFWCGKFYVSGPRVHRPPMKWSAIADILRNTSVTNSVAQESEGSSPHSQQPATGPCPEPVESNPHHMIIIKTVRKHVSSERHVT
jgi:hypothetical protein